jgi:hypothetical protein
LHGIKLELSVPSGEASGMVLNENGVAFETRAGFTMTWKLNSCAMLLVEVSVITFFLQDFQFHQSWELDGAIVLLFLGTSILEVWPVVN